MWTVAGLACTGRDDGPSTPANIPPQRIVSVAPSVTEVLFAIGAGDRVVGRTDWCVHPPAAAPIPSVGGYATPSLEAVLALQPDCVVYLPSIVRDAPAFAKAMEAAGARVVPVEMAGVEQAIATITTLGEAVGATERAATVAQQLRADLEALRASGAARTKPRVLVTLSHEPHALFVAGRGTFIAELLAIAGGVNAVEAEGYFAISAEALLAAAPDVIIDASGPMEDRATAAKASKALWSRFAGLPAVANGRLHLAPDASVIVPGPRMPEAVRMLRTLIHGDPGTGK
jgi:iron complex transport system substrate-binding protein